MNSGGGQKEPFTLCFIEAPHDEACAVFYARFGHNPERVTCTCCGEDYLIDSGKLENLTSYHRRARPSFMSRSDDDLKQSLAELEQRKNVVFIRAESITDSERKSDVPVEGYVWKGGQE